MTDVVNKLWGFCHTLRHDGIDYGDYIEQITYLLFLKMADESGVHIPKKYSWSTLKEKSGTELLDHYVDILRTLGKEDGALGEIYSGALSKFSNPVNLKKLVSLIDEIEWTSLKTDVKAEAYEGLLEKAASEGKKGAGQYFTPRILIESIVRVMKPDPRKKTEFTIHDPAAGTGGFLTAAYEWLKKESKGVFTRDDFERIKYHVYTGQELVERPRRLCKMNLYLHGIESEIYLGDTIYEPHRGKHYDLILTNPPFGTKGAGDSPTRDDFTVSTSNKQLNFVQHILTTLKPGGRTAVVLPDNVLFQEQAASIFEILMKDCDVHTILRLPNGTFTPYSQGVKANVIFFTKGLPTEKTWIFDARSNVPGITKKDRPLTPKHFEEFEKSFGDDPNGRAKRKESERFKVFTIDQIRDRGYHLDIKWIESDEIDEDADLEPEELIETIKESEHKIHQHLEKIQEVLQNGNRD